MQAKQAGVVIVCLIAVALGGWMVYRNLDSGKPTRGDLESVMHNLTTEDLINRRQFMAAQIERAKEGGGGPRPDLLVSAEASLAELDELLRSRGVDLNALPQPSSDPAGGLREERP